MDQKPNFSGTFLALFSLLPKDRYRRMDGMLSVDRAWTPLRLSHFVSFPPDDTVIAAGVAARKCTLFLQQLLVTSANSARGFTF